MNESLRALLAGAIDYAGLFPPASLSLEAALEEYAENLGTSAAWMMGAFVIPASRLGDLEAALQQHARRRGEEAPLEKLAVIGRGGHDEAAWLAALEEELAAAAGFVRDHPRAMLASFEVRLPNISPADEESLPRLAASAVRRAGASPRQGMTLYLEVPEIEGADAQRDRLGPLAAELSSGSPFAVGLKLRMGRPDGKMVPPTASVAAMIDACRRAAARWKATAGLHRALRSSVGGSERHGFVNLLVAAVLAKAHGLSTLDLYRVLSDESAANFVFRSDGLQWQDLSASVAEIEAVRRQGLASFGSCSIAEPWQDLQQWERRP